MALAPLFNEIVDAIHEKDGKTDGISAVDFPARIRSIQTGGGSDFAVPLTVTVDAGATVTAKNGDIELTAISGDDNTAHLILTAEGDWTVSATLGEKYTPPKTVKVTALVEDLVLVAGTLIYYGKASNLSRGRFDLAATSFGDYALFGGGEYPSSNSSSATLYSASEVDTYNADLAKTATTGLSNGRHGLAATTIGNHALFGGGYSKNASTGTYVNTVDAYDQELTRTTATPLSSARGYLAAVSISNHALLAGGKYSSGSTAYSSSTVDAYDQELTRTTATPLSSGGNSISAALIGNFALISNTYGNTVDAYDQELTRTTATPLSSARYFCAITTIGDHALIGGGYLGSSFFSTVDAYDPELTRTSAAPLSVERYYLSATSIREYALFGGGNASGSASDIVDAYTPELSRTDAPSLSYKRYQLAAVTVGGYVLFGGGTNYVSKTYYTYAPVDVYTIE